MSRAVLALALLGCGSHDDASAPDAAHATVTITATVEQHARSSPASTCSPRARCRSPASRSPRRWAATSAATAAICSPADLYFDPQIGAVVDRSRRVLDGRRVVRVLEAADEQPRVRVGRRHVARVRAARQPDGADRRRGDRAPRRARPALRRRRATRAAGSCSPPGTYPANNASGNVNPTGAGIPAEQPARLARHLADRARVRELRSRRSIRRSDGRASRCAISSDDNPGAMPGIAVIERRLRVRRDDAAPARSRRADRSDDHARRRRLLGLEVRPVGHQLPAGHARRERGARSRPSPTPTSRRSAAPGNAIVGADDDGIATAPGTYLGSSDIEGFQAADVHRRASTTAPTDWLAHLTTDRRHDAVGLRDVAAALAYDYAAPLRWFPGAIAVTETDDGGGFPKPAYALASRRQRAARSRSASRWATPSSTRSPTPRNADVGGAQPARAYFDGDPFAADDQLADGEATLHDRALAMMRVALVDLDRLHADPATRPARRRRRR